MNIKTEVESRDSRTEKAVIKIKIKINLFLYHKHVKKIRNVHSRKTFVDLTKPCLIRGSNLRLSSQAE